MDTETKTCPVCGEPVPPSRGSRTRIYCSKKCAKLAWRLANREKYLATEKAWRDANKQKYLAKKKEWRDANLEKVHASVKAWAEANTEKVRANYKAWLDANREKVRAWREANRAKARTQERERYKANPEKHKAKHKSQIASLTDYYVKSLITQDTPIKDVPQSLIDLKRVQVQITRKLKEL